MTKIFIIILFLYCNSIGSTIDTKIKLNKKHLKQQKKQSIKTKIKSKLLAKQINKKTKEFKLIIDDIDKITKKINKSKKILTIKRDKLKVLNLKSTEIMEEKEDIQIKLINSIITSYSSSIAIQLSNNHTLDEIIDSYVYNILSKDSTDQIQDLDKQYKKILKNQKSNILGIKKLKTFIDSSIKDKEKLNKLEKSYTKTLNNLEKQHKIYQNRLKKIISKQNKLSSLLGNLNILKKNELLKAKRKREKEQKKLKKEQKKLSKKTNNKKINPIKKFNDRIKMNVRSIGSSASGIKTTKYKGVKTIAPLKKFTISKKFGKTFDKVYKIALFNDSIELKTKSKKSKVVSVFDGKIVYCKKNSGLLENIVIVQHKNKLYTVYSHLDKIAYKLKVGKWVKKGSTIGRVDNTLTFQVIKDNKYVNPQDLFKGRR